MTCAFTVEEVRERHRQTLVSLGRYRRLSDLVASSLTFLRHNLLLRSMLVGDDLRDRAAGTWHGTPALSALHAHLGRLQRDHPERPMRLVTSAPAATLVHLANLWITGRSALAFGAAGGGLAAMASRLDEARAAFPAALRNDVTAEDAIAESLLSLDSAEGTVVCAFDVERAEKKSLDGAAGLMRRPSAVMLPILVRQGRLGTRPGYASMDDGELTAWLQEMGYAVRQVDIGLQFEARLYTALEWAWHTAWGEHVGGDPSSGHPLILLHVPRSLTMPSPLSTALDREGTALPSALRADPKLFEVFRGWLESYAPSELVEADGRPDPDILALAGLDQR